MRLEEKFTKQVTEDQFDGKEADEISEDEESGKKKTPRAGKLMSWWKKIWPAYSGLESTVQQEKETDKDPDEADKKPAETESSSDLERGPVKTIEDTVAMVSLTRDKEGELFGAETADLEREGKKHEPAGEATYTRKKNMC